MDENFNKLDTHFLRPALDLTNHVLPQWCQLQGFELLFVFLRTLIFPFCLSVVKRKFSFLCQFMFQFLALRGTQFRTLLLLFYRQNVTVHQNEYIFSLLITKSGISYWVKSVSFEIKGFILRKKGTRKY